MIQVNLFVGSHYPVNRRLIRETINKVLADHRISQAQVDVSIVGVRKMRQLNASSLQHDGETDVLSFPQHERHRLDDVPLPPSVAPHLGDIVISFPAAVAAARRYGKLVDTQIAFYLEHSLLHLLGFHHD